MLNILNMSSIILILNNVPHLFKLMFMTLCAPNNNSTYTNKGKNAKFKNVQWKIYKRMMHTTARCYFMYLYISCTYNQRTVDFLFHKFFIDLHLKLISRKYKIWNMTQLWIFILSMLLSPLMHHYRLC